MYTDPIADLLTRIRNALRAGHETVTLMYSKTKENILIVMKEKGFIQDFSIEMLENHKFLKISLKEIHKHLTLKRVSSPGQRIYVKAEDLKIIKSGLGISILSTSKGIMSNIKARKENLGGELICHIY